MNPAVHLKHAWDNTHSMWGKMTIVLFYIFIWVMIVTSFMWMVWPTWMGGCFLGKESDYGSSTIVTLKRTGSLFALGFFLYADRGGIRFWNVTMVFVVAMLNFWFLWSWAKNWTEMDGAPKHCNDGGVSTQIIVGAVWISVSWILSFLEHRAGQSSGASAGMASESTPLNA
jgi:uncharacterized membrane protein (DUF485 family)